MPLKRNPFNEKTFNYAIRDMMEEAFIAEQLI